MNADDLEKLIKTVTTGIVDQLAMKLNQRFDGIDAHIATLRSDLASRDKRISDLQDENNRLRADMSALQLKNDALEGYSRRDNLIFTGVPSTAAQIVAAGNLAESNSTLVDKVVEICNNGMNVSVKPENISTAHRLPRRNSGSVSGATSSSPVVVRFVRRCVRDDVYRAKRELKSANLGYRLYVNEDLSPLVHKIFQEARVKFRNRSIQGTWTTNGKVLVKSNAGQISVVNSLKDLNAFP